jgi:CRP-like cAMP-binding protein
MTSESIKKVDGAKGIINQHMFSELSWLESGALQSNGLNGGEFHSKFFEGLPKNIYQNILRAATSREAKARTILTRQDDEAENVFMLMSGCARHFFFTHDGRKVLLLWLGPGDIFGGMALLSNPSKYLVSTELVKDSTMAVWRRPTALALTSQHSRLLQNALTIASEYMVWYVATHSALVSRTARERLALVLSELSQGIGRQTSEGIELPLRNEELADAANVTPFTVSRLLNHWQRNGALVKKRGKIMLRDAQLLTTA